MRALILLIAFTMSYSVVSARTQSGAAYEICGTRGQDFYDADYLPSRVEEKPCTQARIKAYFSGPLTRLKPTAVKKARQIARSNLTRSLAQPATSATAGFSQLRRDVESEVKSSGADFSQMPLEDAVMLMFMLMADQAEKDLKEMLKDMSEAQKKAALSEKASELRKYICRFIDQGEKSQQRNPETE